MTGAAVVGSYAADRADRWSDIDLAFGIGGPLRAALDQWTDRLYDDFAAVHHWDLPFGSSVYRVFLLPDWLEADIGFFPAAEFGPASGYLAGLAWHHLLHARTCIGRNRHWQAEHWISAARDQVLALACLRLGYPVGYAKGAHLLPAELTARLEAALVRTLDETELRRTLRVTADSLADELDRTDPSLAVRLRPMLAELTAS